MGICLKIGPNAIRGGAFQASHQPPPSPASFFFPPPPCPPPPRVSLIPWRSPHSLGFSSLPGVLLIAWRSPHSHESGNPSEYNYLHLNARSHARRENRQPQTPEN